jgi:phage terminase large subunit-like protein
LSCTRPTRCFEYCELVARQNGKGAILEARALAGFLLLGEALIMWSAHEYKTAMESFRRMRSLLRRLGTPISDTLILLPADLLGHDVYVKVSNTNGDEGFERLDNEQRIKFVARSKGSGRGFTGDCVIIDEAFAYTQEQHEALAPTMSAMPNPQIIYTSSPPLWSSSRRCSPSLSPWAAARSRSSKSNCPRPASPGPTTPRTPMRATWP